MNANCPHCARLTHDVSVFAAGQHIHAAQKAWISGRIHSLVINGSLTAAEATLVAQEQWAEACAMELR